MTSIMNVNAELAAKQNLDQIAVDLRSPTSASIIAQIEAKQYGENPNENLREPLIIFKEKVQAMLRLASKKLSDEKEDQLLLFLAKFNREINKILPSVESWNKVQVVDLASGVTEILPMCEDIPQVKLPTQEVARQAIEKIVDIEKIVAVEKIVDIEKIVAVEKIVATEKAPAQKTILKRVIETKSYAEIAAEAAAQEEAERKLNEKKASELAEKKASELAEKNKAEKKAAEKNKDEKKVAELAEYEVVDEMRPRTDSEEAEFQEEAQWNDVKGPLTADQRRAQAAMRAIIAERARARVNQAQLATEQKTGMFEPKVVEARYHERRRAINIAWKKMKAGEITVVPNIPHLQSSAKMAYALCVDKSVKLTAEDTFASDMVEIRSINNGKGGKVLAKLPLSTRDGDGQYPINGWTVLETITEEQQNSDAVNEILKNHRGFEPDCTIVMMAVCKKNAGYPTVFIWDNNGLPWIYRGTNELIDRADPTQGVVYDRITPEQVVIEVNKWDREMNVRR